MLLVLLLAGAVSGCGSKDGRDQGTSNARRSGSAPNPRLLRGLLVLADPVRAFRACGDTATSWVIDATQGDLEMAYSQLGPGAGAPVYVEVRATSADPPTEGAGAGYRHAIAVTELRRASYANEGGCCDEPRDKWEFRLRGNEPSWSVAVTPQVILFVQPEEPAHVEFPYARSRQEGGRRVYTTSVASPVPHHLEIAIEERRCTDTMSGEIAPFAAQATLDGKVLRGCATEGGLAP